MHGNNCRKLKTQRVHHVLQCWRLAWTECTREIAGRRVWLKVWTHQKVHRERRSAASCQDLSDNVLNSRLAHERCNGRGTDCVYDRGRRASWRRSSWPVGMSHRSVVTIVVSTQALLSPCFPNSLKRPRWVVGYQYQTNYEDRRNETHRFCAISMRLAGGWAHAISPCDFLSVSWLLRPAMQLIASHSRRWQRLHCAATGMPSSNARDSVNCCETIAPQVRLVVFRRF